MHHSFNMKHLMKNVQKCGNKSHKSSFISMLKWWIKCKLVLFNLTIRMHILYYNCKYIHFKIYYIII